MEKAQPWRSARGRARGAAIALLVVGGLLGACSGGSGSNGMPGGDGGAGGPSGSGRPPSFFETEEYRAGFGLDRIRASSAYAEGARGRGTSVAVIDTGVDVDHPEFAGVLSPASVDIATGSAEFIDDVSGHGTAVAGIVGARRNDRLSHGVAFESELLVVRADEAGSCDTGCAFQQSDVAAATDYAVANGAQVINYSLGGTRALGGNLAGAMARAVDRGAILVLAAGNDGDDDPGALARFAAGGAAEGRAIAVGAIDANNAIAGFSNRAGTARDVFLVAPGVGIPAPAVGGGSTQVSGTSFAAPHVSGAAALVLEASPFLRPEEVVALLLESATDLGAPGTDAVYGRGLVDVGAALSPQGALGVPLGATVEGERAPLEATGVGLGPAFGPAPALGGAIFLDAYGRPYALDLEGRVRSAAPRVDLAAWLEPAPPVRRLALGSPGGARFDLVLTDGTARGEPAFADRDARGREASFALHAGLAGAGEAILVRGRGIGGQFGLARLDPGAGAGLLSAGGLRSPYLGLGAAGDGLVLARELAPGLAFGVGVAHGRPAAPAGGTVAPRTTLVGELTGRHPGGAALALQLGTVAEPDSLLDSRGGGALAPGGGRTHFAGLSARLPLAAGVRAVGQLHYGMTDAGAPRGSLIENVSALHSTAAALALVRPGLLRERDRLSLALVQPLRVHAGAATVERPVGRSFEGEILRVRDRVDLAAAGRELDLELAYRTPLGRAGSLGLNWLTRLEPGHDPDAAPAHALTLLYRTPF